MLRLVVALAVIVLSGPARAQTAESIAAASKAADKFLDQGIIGAVAVLAVITAGLLGWALYASMNARLADRQTASDQLAELAERAITGLAEAKGVIENSTRAIEEQGRANETRQAILQSLTAGNAALEKAIDRALDNAARQGARP